MDVINFLNTTCTLLLNKQQALVWGLEGPFRGLTCPLGLEPSLILQSISVFFSFIIGCKVFSINLFNFLRTKEQRRKSIREEKKQARLRDVVQQVLALQASNDGHNSAEENAAVEDSNHIPPFQRRV
jgi:hypothetical protein